MLQASNPNWSLGKSPSRRSGATTFCTPLSLSFILSPHTRLLLFCLVCLVWMRAGCECRGLVRCTFHWTSSSVSSPCHMLVSKTNEHVFPNAVETLLSFSSLAVAHCSLSPVCFPNISHKSDLSKTLNTELPMFHPEWFQRLLKLVVFMAWTEKGISWGHVVLASCKVVIHACTDTLPPLVLTGDGWWGNVRRDGGHCLPKG